VALGASIHREATIARAQINFLSFYGNAFNDESAQAPECK